MNGPEFTLYGLNMIEAIQKALKDRSSLTVHEGLMIAKFERDLSQCKEQRAFLQLQRNT